MVSWKEIGIKRSYTLETSFYGFKRDKNLMLSDTVVVAYNEVYY